MDFRNKVALLGQYVWLEYTTAHQNSLPASSSYKCQNTLFKHNRVFNRP